MTKHQAQLYDQAERARKVASDLVSEGDGRLQAPADWCQFGDQRFSFRTDSQTTQGAAARAGYGVALLARYIVATHEPDLVQVSLGQRLPERNVWLLVRRDLKNVARVRAVTDYLVEVFKRGRRLFAG